MSMDRYPVPDGSWRDTEESDEEFYYHAYSAGYTDGREFGKQEIRNRIRTLHYESRPGSGWCAECNGSNAEQWPCATFRAAQ